MGDKAIAYIFPKMVDGLDLGDIFQRWLWSQGRQAGPIGSLLREFSETGDPGTGTHWGFFDGNITAEEGVAMWGHSPQTHTNDEWAQWGLTRAKVRALYDNWERVRRNRADDSSMSLMDFVIRQADVDAGRTVGQMMRVAERVIERRDGRRNDHVAQFARTLTPPLVVIETRAAERLLETK